MVEMGDYLAFLAYLKPQALQSVLPTQGEEVREGASEKGRGKKKTKTYDPWAPFSIPATE